MKKTWLYYVVAEEGNENTFKKTKRENSWGKLFYNRGNLLSLFHKSKYTHTLA